MIIAILVACGIENTPPSMVGFTLSPDKAVTADALETEITVVPVDAEGDELSIVYRWYVDGELQEDLTERSVSPASTAKGELWRVEVSAFDGRDEGPTTMAEIRIGNTPPELLSLSTVPSEPRSDEDITVIYEATDDDDDPLDLRVQWVLNTIVQSSQDTLSADRTSRGDVWLVEVAVVDGGGVEPTGSVELLIRNALPKGEISIGPENPTTINVLTAVTESSDSDGDSVSWSFDWFIDGEEQSDYADAPILPWHLTSRGQEIAVEGTPFDGIEEGETVVSELVVIRNDPPLVDGVFIDPSELYEASAATCVAGGYLDQDGDPEGEAIVRWLVDEVEVSTDSRIDGDVFSRGQSVQCALRPFDGLDLGEEVVSETVFVLNTPPDLSQASVTLSPNAPTESDTVTYTVSGVTDDDGDSMVTYPTWTINGTVEATSVTELTGSSFDKGDSLQVQLEVWDDTDSGGTVSSNSVTVANSAPTVSSASIDTPVYTRSTATVSFTITDPDPADTSFTSTYAWLVDGSSVGNGSTLDGDTWFERGQALTVTLTPSDGTDTGTAYSTSTVTVENTPPTEPTIVIEPEQPAEEEELICMLDIDSDDDDGDSVTYTFEWDADGTPFTNVQSMYESGDTVPEGEVFSGETWTCTVTPTDSYGDDGDPGTASVGVDTDEDTDYTITTSDLVNQGSHCDGIGDNRYNGCSGNYGFTWTDTGSSTPATVSIEFRSGIRCNSGSRTVTLNGTSIGSFSPAGNCSCTPSGVTTQSFSTSGSSYNPGSTNTITVTNTTNCEGFSVTGGSGSGIYGTVSVEY